MSSAGHYKRHSTHAPRRRSLWRLILYRQPPHLQLDILGPRLPPWGNLGPELRPWRGSICWAGEWEGKRWKGLGRGRGREERGSMLSARGGEVHFNHLLSPDYKRPSVTFISSFRLPAPPPSSTPSPSPSQPLAWTVTHWRDKGGKRVKADTSDRQT